MKYIALHIKWKSCNWYSDQCLLVSCELSSDAVCLMKTSSCSFSFREMCDDSKIFFVFRNLYQNLKIHFRLVYFQHPKHFSFCDDSFLITKNDLENGPAMQFFWFWLCLILTCLYSSETIQYVLFELSKVSSASFNRSMYWVFRTRKYNVTFHKVIRSCKFMLVISNIFFMLLNIFLIYARSNFGI